MFKWLKDFFTWGCPHKDECKYYVGGNCDEEPEFCGCHKQWDKRKDAHKGASYTGTTKYKEITRKGNQ